MQAISSSYKYLFFQLSESIWSRDKMNSRTGPTTFRWSPAQDGWLSLLRNQLVSCLQTNSWLSSQIFFCLFLPVFHLYCINQQTTPPHIITLALMRLGNILSILCSKIRTNKEKNAWTRVHFWGFCIQGQGIWTVFLTVPEEHSLIGMEVGEVIHFSIRLKKPDFFHKITNTTWRQIEN